MQATRCSVALVEALHFSYEMFTATEFKVGKNLEYLVL